MASAPDDPEAIEGTVMTEADVDRMRILSWWASYSGKSTAPAVQGQEGRDDG